MSKRSTWRHPSISGWKILLNVESRFPMPCTLVLEGY
jgi:hypothetical protein